MAKLDRCYVCDYTEKDGSDYSSAAPGQNGRVVYIDNLPMCQACLDAMHEAAEDWQLIESSDDSMD